MHITCVTMLPLCGRDVGAGAFPLVVARMSGHMLVGASAMSDDARLEGPLPGR